MGEGDNNNKTSSSINGRLSNVSLARFKNPMERDSFAVCCPIHLSDVIAVRARASTQTVKQQQEGCMH